MTCPSLLVTVFIDEESVASEISITDVMVAGSLPESNHAPCMTITVPLCKRGNSSTIARSPKIRRLNTATEPFTVVVKDEDVLEVLEAAKSSYLSLTAVNIWEALLQAMKPVRCVYTKNFRSLHGTR